MRGSVNPEVGQSVNLICEIAGTIPGLSPFWQGPNGTDLEVYEGGKNQSMQNNNYDINF